MLTRQNTHWTTEENALARDIVRAGHKPRHVLHLFPGRNEQFVRNILNVTRRRLTGLCHCNRPLHADGHRTCPDCRAESKAFRETLLANGICTRCSHAPADASLTMCADCVAYQSSYNPKGKGSERGGSTPGLLRWRGSGSIYGVPPLLPDPPERWKVVDLFGGSADLLLKARVRGHAAVYNDIHPVLCDLVRVMRDVRDAPEVIAHISTLLAERPQHLAILYGRARSGDPTLSAAMRSAILVTVAHNVRDRNLRRMEFLPEIKPVGDAYAARIRPFVPHLQGVVVENLDFADAIRAHDSRDTVFFLDPPFLGTRCPYEDNLSAERHREMVALLRDIKGRFLLTSSSSREVVSLLRVLPHLWWIPTKMGSTTYKQVLATNYPVELESLNPKRYGL